MEDPVTHQWIELSRDDILSAIKRLRPERMGKRHLAKTLEMWLEGEEVIFGVEGAFTRRPARGQWKGVVCVRFELMNSFLRVRPKTEAVRLSFDGQRLAIGTSRFAASWIEKSAWTP
ncbi:MAG: hypothetical protein RI988_2375 [Pseudomonadota bacterium]|jgi:hypothetical protein